MKYLRGPETLRPTQYCNTPVWWFQGGSREYCLPPYGQQTWPEVLVSWRKKGGAQSCIYLWAADGYGYGYVWF